MAGIGLGSVLQLRKALGLAAWPYAAITLHTHLLTVGFLLNMVMGVAHWMFPRLPGATAAGAARDPLAWANLATLNLGLVLRVPGELGYGEAWARRVLLVSAVLQALGAALFLLAIWKRVRFPQALPSRRPA